MNASIASQKKRKHCTGSYSKGVKNKNGNYLLNLNKSNNLEL